MIEGLNVDKVTASHQRLVLSPYWVVGGPNYTAMAATGCPAEDTCEYRYIFEHIYTYIYICNSRSLSLSIYIYIMYMYMCVCVCVYIYTHTYVYTYINLTHIYL